MKIKHQSMGVGLVEIMIGLLLSSLLSVILFKIYLTIKDNYLFQVKNLRQRHEQLLIINELNNAISQAGFSPCLNLNHLLKNNSFDAIQLMMPSDKNIPASIASRAIKGSIIIKIMRMALPVNNNLSLLSAQRIKIIGDGNYKASDYVVLANCHQAQINKVIKVSSLFQDKIVVFEKKITMNSLHEAYLAKLITQWYFIGKNSRDKPALYLNNGRSEEISDYVHFLTASWQSNQIVELKLKFTKRWQRLLIAVNGL